jgi:aryl-alcohol dehydrogenase-like predicted oxidoreductase
MTRFRWVACHTDPAGLSRQAIFNAVNASLKRLGTDYIDLLQIHRFDPLTPIEETMEALNDLVRSGKVRYIGASSMRTYQFIMMQHCAEKHGWTKFVSMQNQYSLLYREEEREMNRFCNETGVGLIPVSTDDLTLMNHRLMRHPNSGVLSTVVSLHVRSHKSEGPPARRTPTRTQ